MRISFLLQRDNKACRSGFLRNGECRVAEPLRRPKALLLRNIGAGAAATLLHHYDTARISA